MARSNPRSDRIPPEPPATELAFQDVLNALVDPVRRSIIRQLAESGRDIRCGDFELQVAVSTATHHFNVLRDAGVIHQHYEGTSRMNTLRREDLEHRFPGLLPAYLHAEAPAVGPAASARANGVEG